MFERFSPDLRSVIIDAVQRAEEHHDPQIGTEHLLIALAGADRSSTAALLNDIGVSTTSLNRALDDLDSDALRTAGVIDPTALASMRPGRRRRRQRHLPFNGGAKQAMRASLQYAIGKGHRTIDPDHLLLALTSRPESDLCMVLLRRLGLDPHALHTNIDLSMRHTA